MDEGLDHYRILEIDDSADESTIRQKAKANFKRLALKHHPDKNPEDENATSRFQKVCHFLNPWVAGLTAISASTCLGSSI